MVKQVKSIVFIFENLESFEFETKDIGDFYIKNIQTNIQRTAMNCIEKVASCEEVAISLKANANSKYYDSFGEYKNKFSRIIRYNDITLIEINYEDDTKETILIPWIGSDEFSNSGQIVTISEKGNLYLKINKECYGYTFEEMKENDEIIDFIL